MLDEYPCPKSIAHFVTFSPSPLAFFAHFVLISCPKPRFLLHPGTAMTIRIATRADEHRASDKTGRITGRIKVLRPTNSQKTLAQPPLAAPPPEPGKASGAGHAASSFPPSLPSTHPSAQDGDSPTTLANNHLSNCVIASRSRLIDCLLRYKINKTQPNICLISSHNIPLKHIQNR